MHKNDDYINTAIVEWVTALWNRGTDQWHNKSQQQTQAPNPLNNNNYFSENCKCHVIMLKGKGTGRFRTRV